MTPFTTIWKTITTHPCLVKEFFHFFKGLGDLKREEKNVKKKQVK